MTEQEEHILETIAQDLGLTMQDGPIGYKLWAKDGVFCFVSFLGNDELFLIQMGPDGSMYDNIHALELADPNLDQNIESVFQQAIDFENPTRELSTLVTFSEEKQ